MTRLNGKSKFIALAALVLASGGAMIAHAAEEGNEGNEKSAALSADQFINSIRAAIKAKPGQIVEVEAEAEKGVTSCEVKVLASDGKTYEVAVNPSTGKVTSIGLDDEHDEGQEGPEGQGEKEEGPDKD